MPKRSCPFEDNHFLIKTRVSQKEIDLGVNCVENMKRVYAATHRMLFDGAAKCSHDRYLKESGIINGNGSIPAESVCLKSNGYHQNNDKGKKSDTNSCCSANQKTLCYFCEKSICDSCSRTCLSCHNIFCSLCSVLRYDFHDESAVCLSCR